MAKKNSTTKWLPPEEETEKAAKSSIQKTSTQKPKKKMGRPKSTDEETTRTIIRVSTRNLLKKLAVLNDITMTEYLKELVDREAKKHGLLK